MRVVICGWPSSGKSLLARELGSKMNVTPRATDDLAKTHDWSAASLVVLRGSTNLVRGSSRASRCRVHCVSGTLVTRRRSPV